MQGQGIDDFDLFCYSPGDGLIGSIKLLIDGRDGERRVENHLAAPAADASVPAVYGVAHAIDVVAAGAFVRFSSGKDGDKVEIYLVF